MTDAAPETEAPETSGREVEIIPEAGADLVLYVNEHPAIVLLDEGRRDKFFEAIKAEVSSHVPDVATAKGRDAIRSLAMKVTKTKTAIDNAGKKLKEDAQKTVQTVDAARRASKQLLEPLAVEVRAPLTDWETREELRIEKAEGIMTGLREDAIIKTTDTAEEIAARLERIEGAELDPEVLKDRVEGAEELKAAALVALREGLARLQREEADRAELEALRAEKEKAEKEKAARLAAYEAAKAEQRRAAEVEAQRVAYVEQTMRHITDCGRGYIGGSPYPFAILIRELEEKITKDDRLAPDWDRIDAHRVETLRQVREAAERAEAEAAQRAQEAEAQRMAQAQAEAAQAALAAQQQEHERALAAEKRRADELEAGRQAQAAAAAEEARQAAARAADKEHRGSIMTAAKEAIMAHGVGEETAKTIVLAIAAGEVPAVSIRF